MIGGNQHILGFINTSFLYYVHLDHHTGVRSILSKRNKAPQLFFIFIPHIQNEEKLRAEFTAARVTSQLRRAHDTVSRI